VTDLSLERICVPERSLPKRAHWAVGMTAVFPSVLAHALRENCGSVIEDLGLKSVAARVAADLRMRAAYTRPPASSRLPFSYRNVPGPVRRVLASGIGMLQRIRQSSWSRFPAWPLDLSADLASDLAEAPSITFTSTPVLLTHDIDSPEGLENLIDLFLPLEESAGARSASYIVPCAWQLDHGRLASVIGRGHEIGIHGYDHSNATPFTDGQTRQQRLQAGHPLAERYGAVGYRAPSLLRTAALLSDLAAYYRYDSSIPTSGGPFPVPNNGCATARPWRIGEIWELPLTLARDGSLRFLGYRPAEIAALWLTAAESIARSGGIISLLTHCEAGFSGNPPMLAAYRQFLDWIGGNTRFRFVRPMDLLTEIQPARAGA